MDHIWYHSPVREKEAFRFMVRLALAHGVVTCCMRIATTSANHTDCGARGRKPNKSLTAVGTVLFSKIVATCKFFCSHKNTTLHLFLLASLHYHSFAPTWYGMLAWRYYTQTVLHIACLGYGIDYLRCRSKQLWMY